MLLNFLTILFADFGFSPSEPVIALVIGALLIVLPIVARRLKASAIESAQQIHETLGHGQTNAAK